MTINIKVDRSLCMGTGVCVLSAPEVFDQDEQDMKAVVVQGGENEQYLDKIKEAVASCPTGAIKLETS